MLYPTIEIDSDSGFCFGVVNAIEKAEQELKQSGSLYCLGDIVHNSEEVNRLSLAGLKVIEHEDLSSLKNTKLLFRAHGEPPAVYKQALANGITIIDATCPVVLALQKRIRKAYREFPASQIVIYGKKGHAEVNGLVGQTEGKAIVVESEDDLKDVDVNRPIILFSQTTKSTDGFYSLIHKIKEQVADEGSFTYYDTICKKVANRMANMRKFAQKHQLIFFVGDRKSSNGKVLYEECAKQNPLGTFFISSPNDISDEVRVAIVRCAQDAKSMGICGATSTPKWQMESVKNKINEIVEAAI